MTDASVFCLILLAKASWHHTPLLQQLGRRFCAYMFHHHQQHSAGGFGVGLRVVVVKLIADVSRQGVELVVWQVRPDAAGEITGANIIKGWSGQAKMIQSGAQMGEVEFGTMRNHEVGAVHPGQQFRRNGGKFRGIQYIQMSQAVTFNEGFVKPSVAFWGSHQPIGSLRQLAILKDGEPGGADTHARGIGRFKIEAGEIHGVREVLCGYAA